RPALEFAPVLVEIPPGDAVLHRHDGRVGVAQAAEALGHCGDLVGLDGQEHDVVRAGLLGRRDGGDVAGVLLDALGGHELHAAGADRRQVGAPGDERHALAGEGQAHAEVAADGARPDDGELHARPSFWARPMRCSFPVAPFGISARNSTFRGTWESATRRAAEPRSWAPGAAAPSRRTTTAATSSPSLSCGRANVTTCWTAGCSMSTSSTSRGEIFSPPRLMISLRRPVMAM